MRYCSNPLLDFLGIGLLAALLITLFVPHLGGKSCGPARRTACAHNLRQLYMLGTVYASQHRGEWPAAGQDGLWLPLSRTTPPLIEPEQLEVLHCPVKGDSDEGACDYRGFTGPFRSLKPNDVLGADQEENHGDAFGGNVLLKDGSVREVDLKDPLWKQCAEILSP